jgi:hypothetical protein
VAKRQIGEAVQRDELIREHAADQGFGLGTEFFVNPAPPLGTQEDAKPVGPMGQAILRLPERHPHEKTASREFRILVPSLATNPLILFA